MIVIINYDMGNLFSIQSAFNYLGAESTISSDPDIINNAGKLILPGVGSFYKAVANLRKNGLADVIQESVTKRKVPILGICLGMQLLALSSTEDGLSDGFGFIDAPIERFNSEKFDSLKIPHVGFNTVSIAQNSKLCEGLKSKADFYFTHSYKMAFTAQTYAVGTCLYGDVFVAAFENEHICGTQFHPEKSQANGLILLKNFIEKF